MYGNLSVPQVLLSCSYYLAADPVVAWFVGCSTAPRGCCGDANNNNLMNETKARNGARMSEISEVRDEELFD